MKNVYVSPVVKWVGGKRQLLNVINKYVPKDFNRYCEPFLGGGAVLFDLQPKNAVVNDLNSELMNVYKVIESNVGDLILDLKKHKNEADYFYEMRGLDRDKGKYKSLSDVERASRILYLNKTCFNGLFRVNSSGEFNTPFGKYKNPNIVNETTLKAVSSYFNERDITFHNKDYGEVLKSLKKNTFVYLDPPYDPVSDTSSFTGYNKGGFDREEQERLKKYCDYLDKRGIKFLLSNSATDFICELYSEYSPIKVKAKRAINSVSSKRGQIDEVLVKNYDID